MAYDYPYRLEKENSRTNGQSTIKMYSVVHTGEGVICTGPNWDEMRKLVDVANQAYSRQMDKT